MKELAGRQVIRLGNLRNQNRSLFALAKRWYFYTLEGDEGLPGAADPGIPSLKVYPYCPGSVIV
jgi:hypothetical protein